MNEMNPLETRLRSWIPRLPSARLERRVFRRRTDRRRTAPAWLPCVAPAMACVLLATLAVTPRDGGDPGAVPLFNALMSNQSYAAYLPGSFQPAQNRWDTFEWTNHGHSGSSVAPFSPGRAEN